MRRRTRLFLVGLLAGFLVSHPAHAEGQVHVTAKVEILDADTLKIGPVIVRVNGIDAPETGQECQDGQGNVWSCGTVATNRLAELIEGADVSCIPLDRDGYGRLVSRCEANGVDLGSTLVTEGLAWAYLRFTDVYAPEEKAARGKKLGVWANSNQTPWEYRADKWARAVDASPGGCPIKRNINGGKHIYHTPWSRNYEQVVIDESKGEMWFCNEAEAVEAGWRAPFGR